MAVDWLNFFLNVVIIIAIVGLPTLIAIVGVAISPKHRRHTLKVSILALAIWMPTIALLWHGAVTSSVPEVSSLVRYTWTLDVVLYHAWLLLLVLLGTRMSYRASRNKPVGMLTLGIAIGLLLIFWIIPTYLSGFLYEFAFTAF